MIFGATKHVRKSRLPFHWRADFADGLTALSGQVGVFTRAGDANSVAANGRLFKSVNGQLRYDWVLQNGVYVPHTLLEGAGTNICLQSEDFGTTWVAIGSPTRTAAAHAASGVTLDLIGDDSAAVSEYYYQSVTVTGTAAKAYSFCVKKGTILPPTGSPFQFYDQTAGLVRGEGTITWTGDVPSLAMTAGTYLGSVPMADGVYRLLFQSNTCTGGNVHRLYLAPTSFSVVAEQGNIYLGGVQIENNPFPTSYLKTTTATVSRAADALSFALGLVPRSMTVACKFVERGTTLTGVSTGLWSIGASTAEALFAYNAASGGRFDTIHRIVAGDSSSSPATGTTYGTSTELRMAINDDGSVTTGISVDGAAENLGTQGTARTFTSAFSNTTLLLNDRGLLGAGFVAFQWFKIAQGVRTMAEMRALF